MQSGKNCAAKVVRGTLKISKAHFNSRLPSDLGSWGVAMTLFIAVASLLALAGEFSAAAPAAAASTVGTGAGSAAGKLNVHIVCHTHDDAGWLKTVDQYYYGANNTIAHAGVQYILDSVISALEDEPSRKFVYAEQAFMWRWWRRQDDETRAVVRRLVANGQLSFINGGWVMHDEATAHYVGMVDQTHLGHSFIRKEFGEDSLPKVAWQIDPFGHSATQASLLGAQAGFEALYFGRIDYQDREKRIAESDMEMVWRASCSLGEKAQIFTGVFHSGNYGPPVGFCFDQACQDEPIMDDPLMADYNVERRAGDFADACEELGRHTRGDDVMLQMGGDFGFENANAWFKNLDLLMEAVNREGRVNVFYSTPEQYTRAKYASGLQWGVKSDDFFPYADCPNCYWTGYYSSRPGLKRLERVTSAYLQAARQLHALTVARGRDEAAEDWQALAALERAQALVQHHDGVSGTSKQHVAEDYAQRLDRARVKAEALVSAALSSLAFGNGNGAGGVEVVGGRGDLTRLPVLTQCRLSNVSVCDVTTTTNGFVAVAYNTLAHQRTGFLDIPVSSPDVTRVTGSDGRRVEWQTTRFRHANNAQHSSKSEGSEMAVEKGAAEGEGHRGPYTLVIEVAAQPLGIQVLHVVLNGLDSTPDSLEGSDDRVRQSPGEIEAKIEGLEARQTTEQKVPATALSESAMGGDRTAAHELRTRRLTNRLLERAGVHAEDGSGSGSLDEKGATTRPPSDTEGSRPDSFRSSLDGMKEDFSISNGLLSLTFDGSTGRLSRAEVDGAQATTLDVDQGWFYYPTFSSKRRDVDNGSASAGAPLERVSGDNSGAGRESVMLHQELTERLGSSQSQEGGAYILRPERSNEKARPVGSNGDEEGAHHGLALKAWKVVANGPLVWEVHQVFSDWVTQTVRLRRGETHAELDWSVGPVPVGGKLTTDGATSNGGNGETEDGDAGKEVVSRFTASSLANRGVFHTDANGREFQRRERDRRPTWDLNVTQAVAGNFYPVTAAAFIRTEDNRDDGVQLSVLTDRAQGCASLGDGQLEFLAHRRLLTEDQRGVGEALNETDGSMSHFPDWERKGEGEIFRGTHYLVVSNKENAMKKVRALMDEVFSPLVVAFAAEEGENTGRVRPTGGDIDEASSGEKIADDNGNLHHSTRDRFLDTVKTTTNAVSRRARIPEQVSPGLVQGLAENVALMTLAKEHNDDGEDGLGLDGVEPGYDGRADDRLTLLVRFAHRFALGEDPILSQPAAIDLASFIRGHSLLSVEEIALTGGASLANRSQQLKWSTAEHEEPDRREEKRLLGENAGDPEHLARKKEGMLLSKMSEAPVFVVEEGDFLEDGEGLRSEFDVGSQSGEIRFAKVHRSPAVEVVIGPMEIKTFRLEYVRQRLL